jgi:hypothetical protein
MTYHYSDNEQCDSFNEDAQIGGTIGITYWGPRTTNLTINSNSYQDIYFTPTEPKCYAGPDACIIIFNAHATSSVTTDVQLRYYLNHINNNPNLGLNQVGGCALSGVANNGGWQAWEFANSGHYNDTELNQFRIENTNSNTSVVIENIQIVRIYQMYSLNEQNGCSEEVFHDTHDAFDATRDDYPCNWEKCGGRSFTTFDGPWDDNQNPPQPAENIVISPNSSYEWTFNWDNADCTDSLYNYIEEHICLFNFNQVHVTDTDTSASDVKLEAYLNNTKFAEYFISNQGPDPNGQNPHGFFPTYNLATLGYNPHVNNVVKLKNCSSQVSIRMPDRPCINVYRIYKTKPCCPTISSSKNGSGTISPTPGPYPIPSSQGKTFTMSPSSGHYLSNIAVDGTSKGTSNPFTVQYTDLDSNLLMEGHTIVASFQCSTCQTTCDASCQTACEASCQSGCFVGCLACYSCYVGGCQDCQTCETTCQTSCDVSCQTACELSCQNCQTCQTTCQTSCDNCQVCVSCQESETCPSGYYECQSCETCQPCYSCQTTCQVSCDNCQIGCEVICNNCQICVSCQESESCPSGYYECQSCETCQPSYT